MKYLTYILRNVRRNPIQSFLTVASMSISLVLMMILLSFFAMQDESTSASKIHNRIVVMNANGFAGMLPISALAEVRKLDGIVAATPFSWLGGKYKNQQMPFAQFGIDADSIFTILEEYSLPTDQLSDFKKNRDGCVIGRRLAEEFGIKLGDGLRLEEDLFPVDLDLTVRGIYDGESNTDLRMCFFHWDYFDELLKRKTMASASAGSIAGDTSRRSGNSGTIFVKCKSADQMAALSSKIDELFHNSEYPTRTQTEEAFGKMFVEMLGDLKNTIYWIGGAVVISLLFVAGNAMAMAMRERTTEIAVLKAIGFGKPLVLFLILAEAILVSGFGGMLGAIGSKLFCDVVDLSRFTGGFLPYFYVPWNIALTGLGLSFFIGFASGLAPAILAANSSVINGLRKVV